MLRPHLPPLPRLQGLLLVMAIFSVLTVAAALYHGLRLRTQTLENQRNIASSLTRVGEREVTNILRMVEQVLAGHGKDWAALLASTTVDEELQDSLARLPSMRSLSLIDTQGQVLASSIRGLRARRLPPRTMQALQAQLAHSGPQALQVSAPWQGRDLEDGQPGQGAVDATNQPYFMVVVQRTAPSPTGTPGPLLVAVLNPDFFQSVLGYLQEGTGFEAELYNYDGVLLASTEADVHPPGSTATQHPLFSQWLAEQEQGVRDLGDEGQHRQIAAYRTSRHYPLVLLVHESYDAALAGWRTEVWHLGQAVLGTLVFISLLITLLYRQQLHREQTQAQYKSEIALAARVFEDSYDGILITDTSRRILRVNAAFTRSTGYTQDEVQGHTPRIISSGIHSKAFYDELWDTVARTGQWQGEITNRRKNGEFYPERLAISTVRDGEGRVLHYIGIFTDISAIKRQEAELAQARDRAEAANRAKSQFLAVMSHEIRTPLNGILGMAQLLQMSPASAEEQADYAATIVDSGQVLLTLLNDILDLSKVEAGQMELLPVMTDPLLLVREVVTLYTKPAERKGLVLETEPCDMPCGVAYRLDAIRVRQMLNNLVSNALKFTTEGRVALQLEKIETLDKRSLLRFSVTDTGTGIAEDKLAQLFRPFSQVDSSSTRRFGGTGLGLSIVASLARLMGGDVGVESTLGVGSRFWFTVEAELADATVDSVASAPAPLVDHLVWHLQAPPPVTQPAPLPWPEEPASPPPGETTPSPAPPAAAPSAMSPAPTPPPWPTTPVPGPMRPVGSRDALILVAEDNPVNSRFIKLLLQRLGCTQLLICGNGQEALEQVLAGSRPALILMDCQMPVMDGYEATRRIRAWEAEQDPAQLPRPIAIVALTAAAFDVEREACISAGMDDFLTKPVVIQALQSALDHWLPVAVDKPPADTAA